MVGKFWPRLSQEPRGKHHTPDEAGTQRGRILLLRETHRTKAGSQGRTRMMFKRELLDLVLSGVKTQSRRRHKRLLREGHVYALKRGWFGDTGASFRILKVRRQLLRDVTEEEAHAEGFQTLFKFVEKWIEINGSWDPDEEVVVYEFELIKQGQSRLD